MLELANTQGRIPIPLQGLEYRRHLDYLDVWVVFPRRFSLELVQSVYAGRNKTWQIKWNNQPLVNSLKPSNLLAQPSGSQEFFCFIPEKHFEGKTQYKAHSEFNSLLSLLQSFDNILSIKDNETKNKLDQVKLTNFVLQDHISDRTFVRQLISEWNLQKPELPLALSWTEKGWQLIGCWARQIPPQNMLNLSKKAFEKRGEQVMAGGPHQSIGANLHHLVFQDSWHLTKIHTVESLEDITTSPTVWFVNYQPDFYFEDWVEEQKSPLPHLINEFFLINNVSWLIGERRDQLFLAGNGTGTLEWTTQIRGTLDIWPVDNLKYRPIFKYRF